MHYPGAPPPPQQQFMSTPPAANLSPTSMDSANNTNANTNNVNVDSKILSDLSVVQEKIALCQSILTNENISTPSQIDSHDSLLTIIGFLEACVPRVRELIDVGMAVLKEETLTLCFQVNDELCKILDDVEHPEKRSIGKSLSSSTAAGTAAAATTGGANDALETLDFDAFGFEDRKRSVTDSGADAGADADTSTTAQPAAPSKIASSTLEDLLAPPTATPPAVSATSSATAVDQKENKSNSDDGGGGDDDGEFDDFFGSRQVSNNSFSIDE